MPRPVFELLPTCECLPDFHSPAFYTVITQALDCTHVNTCWYKPYVRLDSVTGHCLFGFATKHFCAFLVLLRASVICLCPYFYPNIIDYVLQLIFITENVPNCLISLTV